jgi:hypothetical protein
LNVTVDPDVDPEMLHAPAVDSPTLTLTGSPDEAVALTW